MAVLQQQVAGLEATRGRLSAELVQATGALEAAAALQVETMRLRQEMADMHAQHAACIELLGTSSVIVQDPRFCGVNRDTGEKEEALDEARADLEDIKQVVKQQVLLITELSHGTR